MRRILTSIFNNLRAILQIIPQKLKREYFKVSLLSIILAANEFIGVSVLIPFFNEITDNRGYTYLRVFNLIFSQQLKLDQQASVIFSVGIVVLLLSIKNSISVFIVFKQYRFGSRVQASISENLLSAYLRKPYSEILRTNSSELIRNTIQETNKLNDSVIVPSFLMITDFMLIVAIGSFLLISEPLSSIVLFTIIGFCYGVTAYLYGKKLTAWGKLRFQAEGIRVRMVQEGIGSFVELKLRNVVDGYLKKYRKINNESALYSFYSNAYLQVPRHLLEIFIFISLLLVIFVTTKFANYSPKDILRVLGLFAISAYKLLPTVSRMTNAIQTIRFYKPSMDVFKDIDKQVSEHLPGKQVPTMLRFTTQIEVENIQLFYEAKCVLQHIHMTISKGDMVGIIGKSGSGKTSLANCILGLTKPSSGKITVDGNDIYENINQWRGMIGYVPQTVFLLDDSIQNNITLNFGDDDLDVQRLKLVTEQSGLTEWINSLPDGSNSYVGERGSQISGGQLQRIGIARALYRNPEILIFDEATSALDTNTERQFLETIESLKWEKTILFITHKREPLKLCTKVFRIENGSMKLEAQTQA